MHDREGAFFGTYKTALMKPFTKFAMLLAFAAVLAAQTSEFVAERMPTLSCHASTVVELRPGELMAAWFGGTAEGRPDVAIWGARRQNGHWSAPAELVREPNIATWNPVLFRAGDRIKFVPIDKEEFEFIEAQVKEGTYVYNVVEYQKFSARNYKAWVSSLDRSKRF